MSSTLPSSKRPVHVCFEGTVHESHNPQAEKYYALLSGLILQQPGFISETPFASTTKPGAQNLYARFDSVDSLNAWRNNHSHLAIQAFGRKEAFEDYRIRIGYEVTALDQGPHEAATHSSGKYMLLWQYPNSEAEGSVTVSSHQDKIADSPGILDIATYAGATHSLSISGWSDYKAAVDASQGIATAAKGADVRLIAVIRDYGRFRREEAPRDANRRQEEAAAKNDLGEAVKG